MRSLLAGALVLALLGPVAAHAQAVPSRPAAQSVDPRAEALVKRYLKAVDFEANMDTMFRSMQPLMLDQLKTSSPGLTVEQRQVVLDAVAKVMREKMTPKMIERMTPIYAATLTIPELQALVDFYESPAGRSITRKMPALAPKSTEVVRTLMPEMLAESLKEAIAHLCPNGKCDAATLPKAAAS